MIIHPEKHIILPFEDPCEGIFDSIVAIRPDGERRHLAGPFRNLITNGGLDRPGTSSLCFNYCKVGSGNQTPRYTDSTLQTFVAVSAQGSPQNNTGPGVAPYYVERTVVYTFAQGAAGNLQEIGTSWTSAGGGDLFSRALILDAEGDPTTITVLADEILEVTYKFRYYVAEADKTGTVNGYDYTLRAANATQINASESAGGPGSWGLASYGFLGGVASTYGFPASEVYAGAIGTITGNPSGATSRDTGRTSIGSYGSGNYYRDFTCSYGLAAGNVAGGIMSIRAAHYVGSIQVQFDPVIPKDNTKLLTFTFRHRWARRDPL